MSETLDGYWLEVRSEFVDAHDYPLAPDTSLVFGREDSCQLQLRDPQVSRRHASIHWAGDGFELRDLESSNGTFLNGQPVRHATLTTGDRIEIGGSLFVVHGPGLSAGDRAGSRVPCEHCGRWNPASAVECLGCGAPLP